MNKISLFFDKFYIPLTQVFYINEQCFAMVNHMPFVHGHVLLCTRKIIPKLQLLSQGQTINLFVTANELCRKLSTINGQYEIVLQNGKYAGQTVPHVHLHLIPKKRSAGLQRSSDKKRDAQDMASQAVKYRTLFDNSFDNIFEQI